MRPRYNNTFDYSVQVAEAIADNATDLGISTTSNEALIAGDVNLSDYDAVFWISGEESTADDTFSGTEQTLVTNYLNAGGKLFVSGAEIGWDLDNLNNGRSFYNNQLKADYVSDDANTYDVQGVAGSIFAGLSFSFDDGSIFYDAQFPDRISPLGGATSALSYVGGAGGTAAIQFDGGSTQVVNFGFPFETITSASNRSLVMDRVLEFFTLGSPTGDFDGNSSIDGSDFLVWQRGEGIASGAQLSDGDGNGDGAVDAADLQIWIDQYGQPAASTSNFAAASSDSELFAWASPQSAVASGHHASVETSHQSQASVSLEDSSHALRSDLSPTSTSRANDAAEHQVMRETRGHDGIQSGNQQDYVAIDTVFDDTAIDNEFDSGGF